MKLLFVSMIVFVVGLPIQAKVYNSAKLKVERLLVHGDGSLAVSLSEVVDSACTAGGSKSVYIKNGKRGVTLEGQKTMASLLSSAMLAHREVKVKIDNATEYCYVSHVYVY